MNQVGTMIKELRKKKDITQEQLGEILSVSFQTISKWETGLSSPDINLLPVIASYFGVSIDEIFGYRLDALTYKERFIKFIVDNSVLQFGEFQLSSQRKSPYYINTAQYKEGSQLSKLGEFYADLIRDNGIQGNVLYGPCYNGALLSVITSLTLFQKYGISFKYCYGHNNCKQDYMENCMAGKKLEPEDEVIVIADTITTGKSMRETLDVLMNQYQVKVKGIIIAIDRMEKGVHSRKSALKKLTDDYGIPVYSIITVKDIICAMEHHVIAREDHVSNMKKYYEEYGE